MTPSEEKTLSEYGRFYNLTDQELVAIAKKEWGMDENDVSLLLAIERGEVDGDVIEGDDEDDQGEEE